MSHKKLYITAFLIFLIGMVLNQYKRGCRFHADPALAPRYPQELGTVLITGANTGIGLETARYLVRAGVHTVLACRSMTLCQKAKEQLALETALLPGQKLGPVDMESVDLDSLDSVRACAKRVSAKYPDLRSLVNNAGILGSPWRLSHDGVELHFAVNYLAHFLLTSLLLPHMKEAANRHVASHPEYSEHVRVRVLHVSSRMYETLDQVGINFESPGFISSSDRWTLSVDGNYSDTNAYAQSKLAIILHARELARREGPEGVLSVSIHPGVVGTEILRTYHPYISLLFTKVMTKVILKEPEEGAQTTLHCLLDPVLSTVPMRDNGKFFVDCVARAEESMAWPADVAREGADAYAARLWDWTQRWLLERAANAGGQ